MTIIVKGRSKSDVQEKIDEILGGIEKQAKFDHQISICKIGDEWEGNLQIAFHIRAYPSDYSKPEVIQRLPMGEKGEKAAAVEHILINNGLKKGDIK